MDMTEQDFDRIFQSLFMCYCGSETIDMILEVPGAYALLAEHFCQVVYAQRDMEISQELKSLANQVLIEKRRKKELEKEYEFNRTKKVNMLIGF